MSNILKRLAAILKPSVESHKAMIEANQSINLPIDLAYQVHAKSIGKTIDQLTDIEKRQAFLNATLLDSSPSTHNPDPEFENEIVLSAKIDNDPS